LAVSAVVRRVAIFTGTRADFGLLTPLAKVVDADPRTQLLLIASGTHISEEHGATIEEIRSEGLPIAAEVAIWGADDSALSAAQDVGSAIGEYARVLTNLRPDIVVVLGDRLEALAMATAAVILGVPVAHIHGGEVTEGAMDDSIRHAITKLAHLHFVTTDAHRDRVLQLGEQPNTVFNFGAPALDAVVNLQLLDRGEIERRFGVTFGTSTVLLTFHPAAFDRVPSLELLSRLLSAIAKLPDTRLIVTGTNSDIGSGEIRAEIGRYVERHAEQTDYVESFGQLGYLSTMRQVQAVVGNSSSLVLEAPLLGIPAVLVGDRQLGRPVSPGVLTPEPTAVSILEALTTALSPEFRAMTATVPSAFGTPGFALRALEILATFPLTALQRKQFFDLRVPMKPHERRKQA
jgi:UDP-hydrolysing UDP-N-acetyl-D-glucosamine 2-epimerase